MTDAQRTNIARRSRAEVMFDILEIIQEGVSGPTQLMYRCRCSWAITTANLVNLERLGLSTSRWKQAYGELVRTDIKITHRGIEVLKQFHELQRAIAADEQIADFEQVPSAIG